LLAVILLLGLPKSAIVIYGAIVELSSLMAHSTELLPPALRRTISRLGVLSPDDHLLHHSQKRVETDSNFGQFLSLWDRLFGTYRTRDPEQLLAPFSRAIS